MTIIQISVVGPLVGAAMMIGSQLGADDKTVVSTDGPNPPFGTVSELAVRPPQDRPDLMVVKGGWAPALAIHPRQPRRLVVAYAQEDGYWAKSSADGGKSWAVPVALSPPVNPHADVRVSYSPNGRQTYAAYDDGEGDILFVISHNDGSTWQPPRTILSAYIDTYGYLHTFTVEAMATPRTAENASRIYLAIAERIRQDDDEYSSVHTPIILYTSSNGGKTWTRGPELCWSGYDDWVDIHCDLRLAGGLNGDVVAFYATYDGGGETEGTFAILASRDFGATFTTVREVKDMALWQNIGDIAIGPKGTAHLVYRGPLPGNGDVLYEWSAPPYTKWAAPVRLNDDPVEATQGLPVLAVQNCGERGVVHVAWPDDRITPERHNIFYTRKVASQGFAWSPNLRISQAVVWKGRFAASGTQIAAGGGSAFVLWDAPGSDGVLGSRVMHGVSCP